MNSILNYPLDNAKILRKKKSIRKALIANGHFTQKNIAILGGSTTAEIKNIMDLFLLKNGIEAHFYESEYNQFYEDAVFNTESLTTFNPDIIYIHTTNVNIMQFPQACDSKEQVNALHDAEFKKFQSIWQALSLLNCPIIQNNFDLPQNRTLGNLDGYDYRGKTHFINNLNNAFAEAASQIEHLHLNDIHYLSSLIGLNTWFDRALWYQAKYAIGFSAIPELAFSLSNIINAIFGKTKKCLVLDLDNTCWGGVIGDDGTSGIHIGTETAVAESFTSFQKYAKSLQERGIILAVCSKNDLNNAELGLAHPDSILQRDDFTAFKANWEHKHNNIIDIATEINIGLDSLVFIDDNPAERDIVQLNTQEVSVPNVGSDVIQFIDYIDHNGYFEAITLSTDDLNRHTYYEQNKQRNDAQSTTTSYADFLKSLNMNAKINAFTPLYLDRITQLTNKTNQFNLTTKRYTMSDIEAIASDQQYITLYGRLSDKYGDNGLVAVSIGKIVDDTCHIDCWLMSCRVLKRDMEMAMFDALAQQCLQRGIYKIVGYYIKSKKNSMVAKLYKNLGFTQVDCSGDNTQWEIALTQDYNNKNQHIMVTHD
ncbi:MAG: HAD-IIIC family phosphatase [Methylococcales bacterium]|jgi:FkbH-like protein|nr:HAD-IIIC family phosphatase [Methylococcales bacterium]